MGSAGVLPILLRLAQSGSDEEKGVAVSGLWMLSFKEENKLLPKDEPSFFDGKVVCFYLFTFSKLTVIS